MKWRNLMTFGILSVLVSFVFIGCYTTLFHPKLQVTDAAGEISPVYVDHVDNCNECHQGYSGYSMVTGLGAAEEFESWRFYYEYPWWVDEYHPGTLSAGSAIDMPEARDSGRRRHPQPSNMDFPTTTTSAPAPVPVLTKSTAGSADNSSTNEASSQDDSRRTVGRRKHDTSDSKKQPVSGRRKSK